MCGSVHKPGGLRGRPQTSLLVLCLFYAACAVVSLFTGEPAKPVLELSSQERSGVRKWTWCAKQEKMSQGLSACDAGLQNGV